LVAGVNKAAKKRIADPALLLAGSAIRGVYPFAGLG
jgi:hypothetical protein